MRARNKIQKRSKLTSINMPAILPRSATLSMASTSNGNGHRDGNGDGNIRNNPFYRPPKHSITSTPHLFHDLRRRRPNHFPYPWYDTCFFPKYYKINIFKALHPFKTKKDKANSIILPITSPSVYKSLPPPSNLARMVSHHRLRNLIRKSPFKKTFYGSLFMDGLETGESSGKLHPTEFIKRLVDSKIVIARQKPRSPSNKKSKSKSLNIRSRKYTPKSKWNVSKK